jgi:biotin carboxylase
MSPRLAFVYHPRSFQTLEIADAARGVCDLVWVVDRAIPDMDAMPRLLERLGAVVDVTGATPEVAAQRIAAERPDGILALFDGLMEWTADVAQRLGLPFYSPQTARALADKDAQRAALRRAGMRAPQSRRIPPEADAEAWAALAREAAFPAVVKPRRGESSRNTVKVASLAELEAALAAIATAAPADRAELVLEDYIADRLEAVDPRFADYVSVESVVSAGRVTHLGVTGRMPPAEPFRETGLFLPGALPADARDAVLDTATQALAALGVRQGCLHTEIKLTPAGPCVIEVNGRMGGAVCAFVRLVGGWDLMQVAMRLALGEDVDVAPLPPAEAGRVAYALMVQPPREARRVAALEGCEAIRALPGVEHVILNRGVGAEVDWRAGTNEFLVGVDGVTTDHEALLALRAEVDDLLTIAYE